LLAFCPRSRRLVALFTSVGAFGCLAAPVFNSWQFWVPRRQGSPSLSPYCPGRPPIASMPAPASQRSAVRPSPDALPIRRSRPIWPHGYRLTFVSSPSPPSWAPHRPVPSPPPGTGPRASTMSPVNSPRGYAPRRPIFLFPSRRGWFTRLSHGLRQLPSAAPQQPLLFWAPSLPSQHRPSAVLLQCQLL